MELNSVEEIIEDLRRGRMVVLLDDDDEQHNEGVVAVAAEHITPEHINFMARRACGLICLTLTEERCRYLQLPPMVAGGLGENSHFTLSIEAAEGVSTGISAADRAHTVRVAVAPTAQARDIVQPGHIFPLTAVSGGVLTRAGHTEAASDYAGLAGLSPSAVIADILDEAGNLAGSSVLQAFARTHNLRIGSIADLIHFRLRNERTIEREREGEVQTPHGRFRLVAYRELTTGDVHLALTLGAIDMAYPTLARVHVGASLRDLVGAKVAGRYSWTLDRALAAIAADGCGVAVLLSRPESPEHLLASVDLVLGQGQPLENVDTYNNVGLGCQILRDLGVGKIRLLGAPMKYNALSGFGLEVEDFLAPSG